MTAFEKKPERIEAVQFTGGLTNAEALLPVLAMESIGAWYYPEGERVGQDLVPVIIPEYLELFNTQGETAVKVQVDDWIILLGGEYFQVMSDSEFDSTFAEVTP